MGAKRCAPSMTLDLLAPGLSGRAEWGVAMDALPVPVLETMLSRCRRQALPASGYEHTLCALAGVAPDHAELPVARLVDGARLGRGGGLMCAQPVFLRPDIWALYLSPLTAQELDSGDAQGLVDLFNRHFQARGWRLGINARGAWMLEDREPLPAATTPVGEVAGRDIRPSLPRGPGAARLQALMNEVQMLFHDSDVNRARQRRGLLPVSGLWIYGGGALSSPPSPPWDTVWADEPLAQAIGSLGGVPPQPLPAMFDSPTPGRALACLMELRGPVGIDDPEAWAAAVSRMERDWFGPIAVALHSGILAECRLYDCAGQVCHLRKLDRWRIWRSRVPLVARLGPSKNKAHP